MPPLPPPAPVPWTPGLQGDYPGQESYLHLPSSGTSPVPIIFCWCPPTAPGKPATLGSPPTEPERRSGEDQRQVHFAEGFWLARHPVSQAQWQAVMGANPARFKSDDPHHPVDTVSWEDSAEFCAKTGLALPREDQWEYACRAGGTGAVGIGAGGYLNAQLANLDGNHPWGGGPSAFPWVYRKATVKPGRFPPNAWGLHDMHGQLWEWCADLYSKEDEDRVLRGGCWIADGWIARSAFRLGDRPGRRGDSFGLRPSSTRSSTGAGGSGKPEAQAVSEARDERNERRGRRR